MVSNAAPTDNLVAPAVDALCAPFVTGLRVSGASVSVASYLGRQSTVCSSDRTIARAEALQFELGEGPHCEALASGVPLLCTDLGAPGETRWPIFVEAAAGIGIRGIYAFPMLLGAAIVGVVDLYSATPRAADRDFVSRGLLLAGRAAIPAVQRALYSAAHHESSESPMAPALRREVHQATGIILAQLDISASAAFARLQAHAFVTGRPMEDIAHDVVLGDLAFTNLPDELPNTKGD